MREPELCNTQLNLAKGGLRQFRGCRIVNCIGAFRNEAPWFVDSVWLNLERGEILAHHEWIIWPLVGCGVSCRLNDHQAERQWWHFNTCHCQTDRLAEPP
jgi:hypothetical protein